MDMAIQGHKLNDIVIGGDTLLCTVIHHVGQPGGVYERSRPDYTTLNFYYEGEFAFQFAVQDYNVSKNDETQIAMSAINNILSYYSKWKLDMAEKILK